MQGLLRCMMRQGEFTSAQMHVDGLQMKRLVFTSTFLPAGMHGLYAVLHCFLMLTPHNVLHFLVIQGLINSVNSIRALLSHPDKIGC